jgi:hypothetical protein
VIAILAAVGAALLVILLGGEEVRRAYRHDSGRPRPQVAEVLIVAFVLAVCAYQLHEVVG